MSNLGELRLHRVSGVIEGPSLMGLKTAAEVAPHVRMATGRIQELSAAQVLPHFRIDGGEPLFNLQSLKQYVRKHLTEEYTGSSLPLNLRPVVLEPVKYPVPLSLSMVESRLCEYSSLYVPPCVYFLIGGDTVLYVGQSRNLPSRLIQHRQDGKSWERVLFMPVLIENLNRVENEWIKMLQPCLNRSVMEGQHERQLTLRLDRKEGVT